MASQGLGHIIVVVFSVLFCITGIVIFDRHKKTAIFLIAFSILWVVSIFCIKSKSVKDGEKLRVGIFYFNPQVSNYDSLDLSIYRNVTLIVNADNTFEIHGNIPLLKANHGKWTYGDDGDITWLDYQFSDLNSSQMQDSDGVNGWNFDYGLIHDVEGNRIVFTR